MKAEKQKSAYRLIIPILIILTVLGSFSGCAKNGGDVIENVSQLNNQKYTITTDSGSAAANIAVKTFDKANIVYNSSPADSCMAVSKGRADAFVCGRLQLQYAIASDSLENVAIMDESLDSADIGAGISPGNNELLDEVNAFIKQIKSDGTFDDMYNRWVVNADDTMPEIKKPVNPTKKYKFATAGLVEPLNYMKNNEVTGFDVEFMNRFALYINADITIQTMSFDALVASLESGKIDLVVSDLNITKERKEAILMSDAYMNSETAVLVKKDRLSQNTDIINSIDELNGKNLGLVGGSSFDKNVMEKYPDSQISYSVTYGDLITSLKNGRISAYFADYPSAVCQIEQSDGIKILDGMLSEEKYAFMMAKGNEELQQKINSALAELKSDGTFDELEKKWIKPGGSKTMTEVSFGDAPNGVLKVATSCDVEPFSYIQDNEIVGYDIDMLNIVASKIGYKTELVNVEFSGIIPSVVSGKTDIAADCMSVTPEREKEVLFSTPDYVSGAVAVVLDGADAGTSVFGKIKESFIKTFVTESRWKMVLNGLAVTVELSLLSAVLGTALGFLLSFLLRSKNKFISKIFNIFSTLLDGMPIVILLMVLYYVIFSKSNIPAVIIGVFGFALDFANCVAGLLNTGIAAVDKGQLEAASAMGYTKWQIFKKITLPQVTLQMFSQYTGAIVGLIKGTAVIGYITVEDLTKASDLIRSRTFEAFFPLIATAIIYFIFARIIVAILNVLRRRLEPKRRKRAVKGVKLHD